MPIDVPFQLADAIQALAIELPATARGAEEAERLALAEVEFAACGDDAGTDLRGGGEGPVDAAGGGVERIDGAGLAADI